MQKAFTYLQTYIYNLEHGFHAADARSTLAGVVRPLRHPKQTLRFLLSKASNVCKHGELEFGGAVCKSGLIRYLFEF